jgi:NOL1/NOP2/sun family putative RNA methylase
MKRKSAEERLAKKRAAWLQRTATALRISQEETENLLLTSRRQSIRLNPLQAEPSASLQAMQEAGWQGATYDWCANGYSLEAGAESLRDSPLAADGQILIQNAASWLPVLALDPQPGEHILDVCAAPGGKTTHIAALTNNQANIVANDNSRVRLQKLQAMCRRLGADVERFTLFDATQLARRLANEQFDKILIDAPCSGEGLMRLDRNKDFDSWSVAHIKRLQQLQKRIIGQAWQLLQPGGTLVYSTCTMAPEEDEAVIDYALRALEGARIEPLPFTLPNAVPTVQEWNGKQFNQAVGNCLRLKPSQDVEAFFVCKLRKL